MKTNSRYPAPPQPLLGCAWEAPRARALPLGIVSSALTCQGDVGPSLWELLPLHCKALQTLGCSSRKRDFICLVAQSHPHIAIFLFVGSECLFSKTYKTVDKACYALKATGSDWPSPRKATVNTPRFGMA